MEHHSVDVDDIRIHAVSAGAGPAVVLLHGWPHTWFLWRGVMERLAEDHRVVAPDLRGVGGTTRTPGGYDLHGLADDVVGLLDGLGLPDAVVVGIDAGGPVAVMTALRHPGRVRALVVMEALIGRLPGAEDFLAGGPPWWFGFHRVPGLAETVLEGHEEAYLDFFFRTGTATGRGIAPEARETFVAAYTGRDALRGGFEHYRAGEVNEAQIAEAVARARVTVPTLAVAGGLVGEATGRQLAGIADDLTCVSVPRCGHLVPEERPDELAAAIAEFLAYLPETPRSSVWRYGH